MFHFYYVSCSHFRLSKVGKLLITSGLLMDHLFESLCGFIFSIERLSPLQRESYTQILPPFEGAGICYFI